MKTYTDAPIQAGNCKGIMPEFGRTEDVERLFGIKRGTLYNLSEQKKIRSLLLRVTGEKSGVRLWLLESIQKYLFSEMIKAEKESNETSLNE